MRVLVVEDQHLYRELAREAFGRLKFFDVRYVTTYLEGLAELVVHRPHVIVVDIFIPYGPDDVAPLPEYGEQLIEGAHGLFNPPSIVAWSTDEERAVDYLRRPEMVDDYVVKGFSPLNVGDDLLQSIEAITGHWVCNSEPAMRLWKDLKNFRGSTLFLAGSQGAGKSFLSGLLHCLRRHRAARCLQLSMARAERADLEAAAHQTLRSCPCGTLVIKDAHLLPETSHDIQVTVSGIVEKANEWGRESDFPGGETCHRLLGPLVILTSLVPVGEILESEKLSPRLRCALEGVPCLSVPDIALRLAEDLDIMLDVFRREANRRLGTSVQAVEPSVREVIHEWSSADPARRGWERIKKVIFDSVRKRGSGELRLADLEIEDLPKRYTMRGMREGEEFHERATALEVARALDREPWDLVVEAVRDERVGRVFVARVGDSVVRIDNPQLQGILFLLVSHVGEAVDLSLHARSLGLPAGVSFRTYIHRLRKLLGDKAKGRHESRFIRACKNRRYMLKTDLRILMIIHPGDSRQQTDNEAKPRW